MFSAIFRSEEYEIQVFCPKCGSNNVVVDHQSGFFRFEECLKCGFRKDQSDKRGRISEFGK